MKKSYLLGAACACLSSFISMSASAAPVYGQGTWETTLQARDFDGVTNTVEGWYDTVLNITWLANASLAESNTFGVAGINANGVPNWHEANQWITAMNADDGTGYLGLNNWRLPVVAPINGSSFNTTFTNNASSDEGYADSMGWLDASGNPVSEMGHMFYVNLGNLGFCTPNGSGSSTSCDEQTGWGLSNTGPFTNLQDSDYWTGTEKGVSIAWDFEFVLGIQDLHQKSLNRFAWAVHDGDVGSAITPIPEPSTMLLMGSGLLVLFFYVWRRERLHQS